MYTLVCRRKREKMAGETKDPPGDTFVSSFVSGTQCRVF